MHMRLSGFALPSSIYTKNTNFFAISTIFPNTFGKVFFHSTRYCLSILFYNACFYRMFKRAVETSAFQNNHCHIFLFHFIYSIAMRSHGATGEDPLVVQNSIACVQSTKDSVYVHWKIIIMMTINVFQTIQGVHEINLSKTISLDPRS